MPAKVLLGVAAVLLLTACPNALVNLTPLTVTTSPGASNQVLSAGEPIRIAFSDPVHHSEAQGLLSIASAEGTVSGDLSWSGNTLSFLPVPALTPGKRYNLEYNGQVTLDDGRQFTVVKEVPFYSVSAAASVLLTGSSPAHGASVTVTTPLVLTFGTPIDPASFPPGFSLSPSTPTQVTWSADQMTVTITPTSAWAAVTLYTWQVSSVKSTGGLPLSATVSRSFFTNADQTPPQIVSVVPALWTNATSTWTAAGTDLNALKKGNGVLITTSKPINVTTLSNAWHCIPSLKGHIVQQSSTEAVLVFDDDFALGMTYSFQISTDLQDTVGNALATPYLTSFQPQIPYLNVTEVDLTGVSMASYTTFNQSNVFPLCIPSPPTSNLQIIARIVFDAPFSAADKAQFATLSFCQPLFPTTGSSALSPPTLVTVVFENSSTVVLTYQGFSTSNTPHSPYYYQLKVPGGSSGVKNSAGQSLKEDVWINFATSS